ncbi:MAG: arginine--tRNA ligase [Candidatus Micrarchaeota archaeon]|nr:arginine--tRNA ligase [Candidatus Micrarchaeota archaeon]
MKKIKRKIALYLSKLTSKKVDEIYLSISKPKGGQADLCSTISFLLAKERKTQPAQIAKELEAQLKGKIKELDIKAEGPYLNFYFNKNFFTSLLKKGWKFSKKKKTIMVEYPSVNPNKPWHVGHLRNALLGDSIANLYSFYGFNVLKLDYIDDLGLQIAQSFWGFKNLAADFKAYKNKFDHFVGIQYVQVAKKFQEKEVEEQVRQILKQMEQGIQPTSSQVKEFVYKVLKEQYKTAYNFNIFHNLIVFESDIISSIFKDGVEKIKSSSILKFQPTGQNANCWVIDLSSEKDFANLTQPQKVVIRSDGTATYIAKDIAFQLWKFGLLEDKFFYKEFDCQPNKEIVFMTCSSGKKMKFPAAAIVVNVIGTEQTYLQKIIRFCLSEMGYKKQAKNYIHLSYEHVTLADKKFSGREGSWIAQNGQLGYSADELLDECIKVALSNIKKELSIEKREEVAKAVAINAIKFWFLKTSPNQKIIFDFSRALSLNGDSGPYLLYSFVRAKNILKKAELKPKLFSDYEFNNFEKEFLAQAAFFEEILEHCIKNFEIHPLCSYSLELAEKFNRFYDNCPVLQSDTKTMQMRLYIVDFYCKLIESIFNIIGFVVVEEM